MTEQNEKNREIFLDLCKTVWDFDKKSLDYVSKRTEDSWEVVPELKEIFKDKKVEDQRVRYEIDMSNQEVQSFFEDSDEAYKMFKTSFDGVIRLLKVDYSCNINYSEFITNKCIFKKNTTKIKKVFETVYAEHNETFEIDSGCSYTKEKCAEWIVKKFERIGASKKSAKKLQLVITYNPIDWLMSSTSESWSSCFNINNSSGGFQYCLGLPFQCGDKNRIMIYITDGSQKDCMGIKVDHYQTRTWALLGTDNHFHIVKWYPNDTIGVKPVSAITGSKCFDGRSTFKEEKYPIDVLSTKKGAVINVYSDMGSWKNVDGQLKVVGNDKDGQQFFTRNLINVGEISNSQSFQLSQERLRYRTLGPSDYAYKIPYWKKIGLHLDAFFPTFTCTSCREDKAGVRLNDDSFICFDCYKEKIFTCDNCKNSIVITGENKPIEITTAQNIKMKICKKCYDKYINNVCGCCGKMSFEDLYKTDDETKICSSCLSRNANGYRRCDNCEKITKNIKVSYNTYTKKLNKCCSNCESNDEYYISSNFRKYYTILTQSVDGMPVE